MMRLMATARLPHPGPAANAQPLEALSGFARELPDQCEVGGILQHLTERATEAFGLAGAGVILLRDGVVRLVASANPLDTFDAGGTGTVAGPGAVAATTGHIIAADDLAEEEWTRYWPEYTARARQLGIQAMAAIPMMVAGEPIGVMNLYSASPRQWTPYDLQVATILADIAAGYLARSQESEQQRRTAEQLQRALNSRIVIEQAKGMLAAAHGTSIDEAFRMLRKHARDHNVRIHDVASAVVNLGLRL